MHDKTKCGHGVDGGACGICNAVDRALPPYNVLVKPRAKAVPDLVSVEPSECDGDYFLTVDIDPADPYGSFKKLPAGLEYEGRLYGKSAYNSDRNKAYYKAGLPLAEGQVRRPRIVMASAYIERARKRLVKERNRAATLERARLLDDAIVHLEAAEATILRANVEEEQHFEKLRERGT